MVVCTNCGKAYPGQELEKESYRPIGTDGTCSCGNVKFKPVDNI